MPLVCRYNNAYLPRADPDEAGHHDWTIKLDWVLEGGVLYQEVYKTGRFFTDATNGWQNKILLREPLIEGQQWKQTVTTPSGQTYSVTSKITEIKRDKDQVIVEVRHDSDNDNYYEKQRFRQGEGVDGFSCAHSDGIPRGYYRIGIAAQNSLTDLGYECTKDGFFTSIKANDLEAMKDYFLAGIQPNMKDDNYRKPAIVVAAQHGALECMETLVTFGADINAADALGNTALSIAVKNQYPEAVEFLLENGATSFDVALAAAAEVGSDELVALFLAKGANINARTGSLDTALIRAATNGHLSTVEYLLQQGADINKGGDHNSTALIKAAANGHLDIVKLLIPAGPDINALGSAGPGWTPLMGAALRGHKEVVELLLSYDISVNTKSKTGGTALFLAEQEGHDEIVNLLKRHGAKR